jgi:serine phosphatase RsbU (regulator of sigma subunit)
VLAVVGGDPPARSWAGVSIGITEACGDAWAVTDIEDGIAVAVVDGLGHGVYASAAADAALAAFAGNPADLGACLRHANETMRGTRGGALALCRLEPRRGVLHFVGLGNVSGRIQCGAREHGLVSLNGTVGIQPAPPRSREFCYPWPPGATLTLWTDGLTSRIDLAKPGLFGHDPAIAAATLHRDHSRERDDATVVVVTNSESP